MPAEPSAAQALEIPTPRSFPQSRRLSPAVLLGVYLVALLPHLVIAILFRSYPIALDDMFQYDMLARSLASGQGYRWYASADVEVLRPYLKQFLDVDHLVTPPNGLLTTFRPPGYPFFLALVYRLAPFTDRLPNARLAQAVLAALLAPAAALLGVRIGLTRRQAIWSGLAVAGYPILLVYPVALASEDLFIPLVLFGILALLWAAEKPGVGRLAIAGGLLGLGILTRSVLAFFVPLAAWWLWRFAKKERQRWLPPLCLIAVVGVVCLPWAVRNSLIMKHPAFIESALNYQMYIGYHPEGDGGFVSSIAIRPLIILDDTQRDRFCSSQVIQFIRDNPGQAPVRFFRRAAFFLAAEDRELFYFYTNNFFGDIPQPWLGLLYLAIILPWFAVGLFAFLGLSVAPNRSLVWLALALVAGYSLPHLLIIAEPRFHLALVPVLMPFAVWGFAHCREAMARLQNRWPSLSTWSLRFGLLALVIFWIWGFALHWNRIVSALGPGGNTMRFFY